MAAYEKTLSDTLTLNDNIGCLLHTVENSMKCSQCSKNAKYLLQHYDRYNRPGFQEGLCEDHMVFTKAEKRAKEKELSALSTSG